MNRAGATLYTMPVTAFATISISLRLRSEIHDSIVLATKVEPSQTGTGLGGGSDATWGPFISPLA